VTAHIPLALVLGLLSVLILVSYFGSALMQRKDPIAVSTGSWQHATAQHVANHLISAHKSVPKAPAETNR
jgi:Na+-transporting methylmalonyl-CoA/oxaloacetate decarboxylase gamma subunit